MYRVSAAAAASLGLRSKALNQRMRMREEISKQERKGKGKERKVGFLYRIGEEIFRVGIGIGQRNLMGGLVE